MSVGRRIKETGKQIRGITPEQLEFIVKYYGIIPAAVIASILGISRRKVYHVARKLGLKPRSHGYPKYIAIRVNDETIIYERD